MKARLYHRPRIVPGRVSRSHPISPPSPSPASRRPGPGVAGPSAETWPPSSAASPPPTPRPSASPSTPTSRTTRSGSRSSRAIEPVQTWLAEKKPDVLFFIYNDHVTSFFFDHYSAFALGVGEEYAVADEGGGARDLPPIKGHAGAGAPHRRSRWWPTSSTCPSSRTSRSTTAASRRCRCCCRTSRTGRPPIVPLQMGVLQFPMPTARALLQARPGAAHGDRELSRGPQGRDRRHRRPVAPGPRRALRLQQHRLGRASSSTCSRTIPSADRDDPRRLRRARRHGRRRGHHVADDARRAVGAGRRCTSSYYLPSMTGIATAIYENQSPSAPMAARQSRRDTAPHRRTSWRGVEKLPKAPIRSRSSAASRRYRLNNFLHDLIEPEQREPRSSPTRKPSSRRAGLTEEERDLIRRRDWRGADPLRRDLLHAGEARRRDRRVEPAHLRRDARPIARRLPEDPQRPRRAVFGGGSPTCIRRGGQAQ